MLRTLSRSISLKGKFYFVSGFFVFGYLLCGALAYSTFLSAAAFAELQFPFVLGGGVNVLGCFLAWYLADGVARPLGNFAARLENLSHGDAGLVKWVKATDRRDELGEIGRAHV